MTDAEIILFFKSGKFCEKFGHQLERKDVYDDCARFECKYCEKEEWS